MKTIVFYTFLFMLSFPAYSQEENTAVYHAKKYLDINIKSQEKCDKKAAKHQQKALKRLNRKEKRYASRLRKKNAGAYDNYKQNELSYDSISKIKPVHSKSTRSVNSKVDSLKGVKKFLVDKAHITGDGPSVTGGYDNKLSGLARSSEHQKTINNRIKERTNLLQTFKASNGESIRGTKSIQKQSFYSNKKLLAYQQMADDPSAAESKALEYLQGQDGFNESMLSTSNNPMSNGNLSVDDLKKMGFQTKGMTQQFMQKKLGGKLGAVTSKMGSQIKEYQEHIAKVNEAKNTAKKAKSSFKKIRHIDEPDFKINPMRGLPFSKKIEQQFNWQISRAAHDGNPALFNAAYNIGIKQTASWSYGIGAATTIGLGRNWNNIQIRMRGGGPRAYTSWTWHYGIGIYGEYERMFKFKTTAVATESSFQETAHNTGNYTEAIRIGLVKEYRISDQINGSVQFLYDIWWKEKGLRSPIQIRFATTKN